MKLKTLAAGCLVASLSSFNAQAMDIELSGFASVVAGKTLGNDESYLADKTYGSEGVYDNDLSFRPESLMAIQAKARVSDRVSATGQILAKGSNDFDARFEWLYLTYQLTEETGVNVGRFRMPFYYYSDYLDVGYSYYWVRPPVDVYNIGHTSLNGVTVFDRRYLGDIGLFSQAWYGTDTIELNGVDTDVSKDFGLTFTLKYEWAKLRFMHNSKLVEPQYTDENRPSAVGDVETVSIADISYDGIAFMADYKNFMWRSEYTRLEYTFNGIYHTGMADVPISSDFSQSSWYISLGYNIGQFTPYFTHSYLEEDATTPVAESKTNTIGIRWDFETGTALKLEYSKLDTEELLLPDTTILPAAETKLINIAVDMVF